MPKTPRCQPSPGLVLIRFAAFAGTRGPKNTRTHRLIRARSSQSRASNAFMDFGRTILKMVEIGDIFELFDAHSSASLPTALPKKEPDSEPLTSGGDYRIFVSVYDYRVSARGSSFNVFPIRRTGAEDFTINDELAELCDCYGFQRLFTSYLNNWRSSCF